MPQHGRIGLDDAKGWGYMRWPSIISLYNELTKDSSEEAVDTLWNNILQIYFRVENNYVIIAQTNMDKGKNFEARVDFALRCVRYILLQKVILIEHKPVGEEDFDAVWNDATEQLLEYMNRAHAKNPPSKATMYGIVTVGFYSRFYMRHADADDLDNFSCRELDYNGERLHFQHDEDVMHKLLKELAELASE